MLILNLTTTKNERRKRMIRVFVELFCMNNSRESSGNRTIDWTTAGRESCHSDRLFSDAKKILMIIYYI